MCKSRNAKLETALNELAAEKSKPRNLRVEGSKQGSERTRKQAGGVSPCDDVSNECISAQGSVSCCAAGEVCRDDPDSTSYTPVCMPGTDVRKIIFFSINLNDANAVSSVAQIEDAAWGATAADEGLNELIIGSSYGRVRYNRSVSTVLKVDIDLDLAHYNDDETDPCPHYDLATKAKAAATAAGYNWQDYDHRVYYIPTAIKGCGWGGLANVCCSSSFCNVWMRSQSVRVLAHEIGHNLCLRHASRDTGNDGNDVEYGDGGAIMGGGLKAFNAPHRIARGWLPQHRCEPLAMSTQKKVQANALCKQTRTSFSSNCVHLRRIRPKTAALPSLR